MRVGITGGAGFVGSHVIDELHDRGLDVLVFDTHAPKVDAEWCSGDITDPLHVETFAGQVDAIIHLAAVLGTTESLADPRPSIAVNIGGTANVLLAAQARGGIPVIAAGVGNFQMLNSYAITKVAAERLCFQFREELGVTTAVVRGMSAYGPRQTAHAPFGSGTVRKIGPSFILHALTGRPLEINGNGTQISDMVYARDLARAFYAALAQATAGFPPLYPVEVGPAEPQAVIDTAKLVVRLCEDLGYPDPGFVFNDRRPGEQFAGLLPAHQVDAVAGVMVAYGVPTPIARHVTRALSNRVSADPSSLAQIGLSPDDLTPLEIGMAATIDYYIASEGVSWSRPA